MVVFQFLYLGKVDVLIIEASGNTHIDITTVILHTDLAPKNTVSSSSTEETTTSDSTHQHQHQPLSITRRKSLEEENKSLKAAIATIGKDRHINWEIHSDDAGNNNGENKVVNKKVTLSKLFFLRATNKNNQNAATAVTTTTPVLRRKEDYDRTLRIRTSGQMLKLMDQIEGRYLQDDGMLCRQLLGNIGEIEFREATSNPPSLPRTLVDIEVNSNDINNVGDSEILLSLYGLRLVADTLGNIDIRIAFSDEDPIRGQSVLPWINGVFKARKNHVGKAPDRVPSYDQVCKTQKPLHYKLNDIRYQLRRMAVMLVGVPSPDHPSAAFVQTFLNVDGRGRSSPSGAQLSLPLPQQQQQQQRELAQEIVKQPLFPNTELDDVVVFVECSDLMGRAPYTGLINYNAYLRNLSPNARSIGILTEPLTYLQSISKALPRRCNYIVNDFVNYLGEEYPHLNVTYRNDTESTAMLSARIIMANQTMFPLSTFSVLPALSTFGTTYIRRPVDVTGKNGWLLEEEISDFVDNVIYIDSPLLEKEYLKLLSTHGFHPLAWWMRYSPYESLVGMMQGSSRNVSITNARDLNRLIGEIRGYMMPGFALCRGILGNVTLDEFRSTSYIPPTNINITFNSTSTFMDPQYGTGNVLWAFYGLRLIADTIGNVDVTFTAIDAEETKHHTVFPWLTGFFPRKTHSLPVSDRTNPSLEEACSDNCQKPLLFKIQDIRFELRRMAVALVGIPYPNHPSAAFAEKYLYDGEGKSPTGAKMALSVKRGDPPIFPNVELDDVILHFRCGDLMRISHERYSFMNFHSYARHISRTAKSIGIATQPFQKGRFTRDIDTETGSDANRCETVVNSFVTYLKNRFPHASVTIRNDPNETSALAFARMIMANQTVVAVSSFGVFPALATFGASYIRRPNSLSYTNGWLMASEISEAADNVKLVYEPQMTCESLQKEWTRDNGKSVLKWFRGETEIYDDISL